MDFSDQLCFRKLLTVLHRFLKTLFIMKSTKTIFAISSIRCIKPLNSSSSCSPEQVYFSKKQKTKKNQKNKKIHASYEPRNTTVLVFLERELLRVVHLNSCSVIPVPGVDEPESVVLLHQ